MFSFVGMCCHKISCKFLVLHINNKYFHGIILSFVLNFASSHKQCAGSFLLLYMPAVSGYDITTDGGLEGGRLVLDGELKHFSGRNLNTVGRGNGSIYLSSPLSRLIYQALDSVGCWHSSLP